MATDWLRPTSLGGILDRTFSLYRRHFLLLVCITAPQAVVVAAMGFLTNRLTSTQRAAVLAPGSPPDPAAILKLYAAIWPIAVVLFLVGWLAAVIAHGAATTAVSRIYLGKSTGAGDSFARLKGRFGRLVLVSLGVYVRILGLFALVMLALIAVVAMGAAIHAAVLVVMMVLGGLAAFAILARFMLGYMVAVPALIVEDSGAGQAIARSVNLMRGHRLRGFAILILMGILSYAALMLFQGPFIVLNVMAVARHTEPAAWVAAGLALGQAVAVCLTGPFGLVAFVLLYFDLRIRKEAFDLTMLAAGAGDEEAALKPPPIPAPGSLNL